MATIDYDFKLPSSLSNKLRKSDYIEKICQKIVKSLRSNKSQQQMNIKLGYEFNQYAKWERGQKQILWEDLLEICDVLNIKIFDILKLRFAIPNSSTKKSGQHILQFILNTFYEQDLKKMALSLGITASSLRRQMNGSTNIKLVTILNSFLYRPILFLYFLNDIGVLQDFLELQKEFLKINSLEKLEAEKPYCTCLLYFIETSEYKELPNHDIDLLAKLTGLTALQVRVATRELADRGLISEKNKKFEICKISNELNSLTIAERVQVMSYWQMRSISYLYRLAHGAPRPPIKNHNSFRAFTTTKSTAEKITEKLAHTYFEICQMIKQTDPTSDEIVFRAILLNHFGLKESAPLSFELEPSTGFKNKDVREKI